VWGRGESTADIGGVGLGVGGRVFEGCATCALGRMAVKTGRPFESVLWWGWEVTGSHQGCGQLSERGGGTGEWWQATAGGGGGVGEGRGDVCGWRNGSGVGVVGGEWDAGSDGVLGVVSREGECVGKCAGDGGDCFGERGTWPHRRRLVAAALLAPTKTRTPTDGRGGGGGVGGGWWMKERFEVFMCGGCGCLAGDLEAWRRAGWRCAHCAESWPEGWGRRCGGRRGGEGGEAACKVCVLGSQTLAGTWGSRELASGEGGQELHGGARPGVGRSGRGAGREEG